MPEIATKTENKTETKERLKEITDKLEQGIKDLFDGEKFKEYLDSMSKFHNYSFNNTLLIAMQKPDASLVAGFNTWKNKFGRHVNKGEKGIQILAPAPFKVQKEMEKIDEDTGLPMLDRKGNPIIEIVDVTIPFFKPVSVFDVSQTNGKALPSLGADELSGEVKDYEKFFEALKAVSPLPIEFEKITDGAKGYCDHANKRIAINEGMSELQNVKTAVHEIAHAKLHYRDLVKADLTEAKDKKTMEIEAESIAYTVCQHYGIDTSDYSFGYVAAWGSGKEVTELKASLETIRATASEIINKIDVQIEKSREQEKEQEAAEQPEKPSNIIGNTEYKDIAYKTYFKVDNQTVPKIIAALEVLGVKFSGRTNKTNTTFTVSAADVDKFKEAERAANAHKIPPQTKTAEIPEKPDKTEKKDIIGNVNYTEIIDKKYFKIDTAIADKIAAELEKQGVKFSGRICGDKTTLTIGNADAEAYKKAYSAVKFAESERKIADKMPENLGIPDTTYTFKIYQINDNPENREFRFATLKSLEDKGISVNSSAYDLVYTAEINANGRTKEQVLEDIYTSFNVEHPKDFAGRSLSVSDVIVMEKNGVQTAHYSDNIGFAEIKGFFGEKAEIVKTETQINETPKAGFPAVYINNLSYARDHGEIEAYKESRRLNTECAVGIYEAIKANSKPGPATGTQYVDTEKALKEVAEKFGIDRVKTVSAMFVTSHIWDGRISEANKSWAKKFDLPSQDVDIQTNPAIFDGFLNKVRNAEKILDKKPSLHDKMKAKAAESVVKKDGKTKQKGEAEL